MTRPTLLFLTTRNPYAEHGGDRVRARAFIAQLSLRFYVSVWHMDTAGASEIAPRPTGLVALRSFDVRAAYGRALLAVLRDRNLPLQVARYDDDALHQACVEHGAGFDAVVAHLIRTATYLRHFAGSVRVLDYCDSVSENARQTARLASRLSLWRWINRFEAPRADRFERSLVTAFDLATVASLADQAWLDLPPDRTIVLPQGVQRPASAVDISDQRTLLFVGQMDYFPNRDAAQWFAQRILPNLPGWRLRIAGRTSEATARTFAAMPQVEVVGRFDSITDAARDCSIAIAPMRVATGLQTKLLDYLAVGLPVVASQAAARGLPAGVDITGIQVVDGMQGTEDSWTAAIEALFADRPRRVAMRAQGLDYVATWHDWPVIVDRLGERMSSLLNHRASTATSGRS